MSGTKTNTCPLAAKDVSGEPERKIHHQPAQTVQEFSDNFFIAARSETSIYFSVSMAVCNILNRVMALNPCDLPRRKTIMSPPSR